MGDLENKQTFDFGAEIITAATVTSLTTAQTGAAVMLSVNGKQSTHEQQQYQQHQQQTQQQQQQILHNHHHSHKKQPKLQQDCFSGEMSELKSVEQQVLRKSGSGSSGGNSNAAIAGGGGSSSCVEVKSQKQQEQEIQTNIVMKTKVTEKCGINVVDNSLVMKCNNENKQKAADNVLLENTTKMCNFTKNHKNDEKQQYSFEGSYKRFNDDGSNGDCEGNGDEDDDNKEQMTMDEGAASQEDEVDTDESSSDSNFSDISGLSDVSGREWKPISARPLQWVQKQIHSGANPRDILSQILPNVHQLPSDLNDMALWRLLASMLSEPPRRQKLRSINSFEDVIHLLRHSKNIIVLTGAGVSVSCGIPDFRSSDGIYSRLAKDYPDLPDPQAMFDINYFSKDPRPFYKFAREIYPGQFKPSPCHRFIKLLEEKQKLLRNYTQNIDTLEQVAGIQNVIECHGSFSTASCTKCKYKCDADAIRADIFAQRIPVCPQCQPNVQQSVDASEPVCPSDLRQLVENGIMKPDIVFFGEGLPEEFHTVMASDKDKCDLLIVIGSSLKVRPVALIPSSIPPDVPQILINREQLHHLEFDVELLGDSDVIINQICHCLGKDWEKICYDNIVLKECKELLPNKIHFEEEDFNDNDTQSLQSNTSNDVQSQTGTGTNYADSGFESSASSTTNLITRENLNLNLKDICIGRVEDTNVNGIKESSAGATATQKTLPPELIEGPNECHTFAERLSAPAPLRTSEISEGVMDNYRHFSVDSTKDSGIGQYCGESSDSSALTPPLPDNEAKMNLNSATTPTAKKLNSSNKMNMGSSARMGLESKQKRSFIRNMSLTAADRLPPGCYYCHEKSSSYVFPGAQVTLRSVSEDEEEEDLEEIENDEIENENEEDEEEPEEELVEGEDEGDDYCDEEKDENSSSNIMNEAEETCEEEDEICDYDGQDEDNDEDLLNDSNEDSQNDASSLEFETVEEVIVKDSKTITRKTTTLVHCKRNSNGVDVETSDCLTKTKGIFEVLSPPPNKKSRNSFDGNSFEAAPSSPSPPPPSLSPATTNSHNFCLENINSSISSNSNSNNAKNSNNSSKRETVETLLQPHLS